MEGTIGKGKESLTDPVIWPFATCDHQHFSGGSSDGDGAADNARGGAALCTHEGV